ncbi:stage 0 sporulation protein B (sporulation initiation phosphotransferase) [Planomicrobium stackebrandtii]|uniref:Stage 0 sporulation protein B (Sporulation initiation phosphotransferase) n=1 Tax=Planomicrobium stackebrandtii TaxID=253160 RepID=A0ABU0GX52_9BACL|nr:Spo0B domain-containing protein [Planomicrobium stackebrandtii]MDQ0429944.1 stage 0 sporulation protein B (sporulation initiation phosphotransferase) [Planomicrobium stackebrandtii]
MEKTMTVAQSLRHARHDFLNELQLIKMNLDLGRHQEAQAIIRSHAEAAMHASRLSDLGLPLTEEWLLTANWRFSGFRFQVECPAVKAPVHLDAEFWHFLENFVEAAKELLDPYQAFNSTILLVSNASSFEMNITCPGHWLDLELSEAQGFTVRKECSENSTLIAVRAQMEG